MPPQKESPEEPGTPRHRLRRCLEQGGPRTVRELSQLVSLSEREVDEHLTHLERTLLRQGGVLVVDPARCRECAFRFEHRSRARRPSRCPSCRSERIDPARFSVRAR